MVCVSIFYTLEADAFTFKDATHGYTEVGAFSSLNVKRAQDFLHKMTFHLPYQPQRIRNRFENRGGIADATEIQSRTFDFSWCCRIVGLTEEE